MLTSVLWFEQKRWHLSLSYLELSWSRKLLRSNQRAPGLPLARLFNQNWSVLQKSSRLHMKATFVLEAVEAVEAGETGVRAEQLSVCTLQAGSVCSVDTGGVRRVSALSSVPLHGYACV